MPNIHDLARKLTDMGLPASADEQLRGRIRAHQIQLVARTTPLTMVSNIVNSIVFGILFHRDVDSTLLIAWASASILVAALALHGWWRNRGRPFPTAVSRRSILRLTQQVAIVSVIWALSMPLFFNSLDGERQAFMTGLVAGTICVGAMSLHAVPAAVTIFIGALASGAVVTLVLSGKAVYLALTGLIIMYCGIVLQSALSNFVTFVERLTSEAERQRQSEVISLLLHDFEENASDWLWEADPQLRLQHVSQRFAEKLGCASKEVLGVPLLHFIPEGEGEGARQDLLQRMMARQAFRDLIIPVTAMGETRWWSLSAKPVWNERGHFAGYRGAGSDITESRRLARQITDLARLDAVTGLANRHEFNETLEAVTVRLGADPSPVALLCIDLDNFKGVNDTLGHAAGDTLLRQVSERLRGCAGQGATIARLGGDEFAIIAHGLMDTELVLLARTIIDQISEPYEIDGVRAMVGASIGIALAPAHGRSAGALLRYADLALYRAKGDGRGTFHFFDPQMEAEAQARLDLEHELRHALEAGDLHLHYQPVVDLKTGELQGYEALARWNHPERGVIPPSDFIRIAEESGLIIQLGEWALKRACADAKAWPEHLFVAVNMSAVQFFDSMLPMRVTKALMEAGLAPGRLEIEITETVFLNGTAATLSTLESLRGLGVRLVLDDFGIGYSSLSYLRHLPVERLKIDRAFVKELEHSAESRAIVRAIIELAHTLNLETTAEGVETQGQADHLAALGCGQAQGYLFGRPRSLEAAAEHTLRTVAA